MLTKPSSSTLSIWRPVEVFGPGLSFGLDSDSRAIALLVCAVAMAACLRRGERPSPLTMVGWGFGLAAVLGSNAITVALAWSLLSITEAGLLLNRGAESGGLARRLLPHSIGAILLIGLEAAPFAELPAWRGAVVGSAILLRSATLDASRGARPSEFAVLNRIVAVAAWLLFARSAGGGLAGIAVAAAASVSLAAATIGLVGREWAGSAIMAVGGVSTLVLSAPSPIGFALGALGIGLGLAKPEVARKRFPQIGNLVRRVTAGPGLDLSRAMNALWRPVSRWIRSATELLEGQSAVLWMFLALLAIVVATRSAPR